MDAKRCPLIVASLFSNCLLIAACVSPGHPWSYVDGVLLSTMGIRHRRVCISRHPLTHVRPPWSISTPSLVNITLHPASHSSATATKLCNIFGMQYPRVAACGSDDNASSSVLVVFMWLPLGT
eukprot:10815967-Ditylum_brightwellii.AAC.1